MIPPQPFPCPLPSTGDELLDAAQDVCWRYLHKRYGNLSPMDIAVMRLAQAIVDERARRGLPRDPATPPPPTSPSPPPRSPSPSGR